jgi:hypothetical protein
MYPCAAPEAQNAVVQEHVSLSLHCSSARRCATTVSVPDTTCQSEWTMM